MGILIKKWKISAVFTALIFFSSNISAYILDSSKLYFPKENTVETDFTATWFYDTGFVYTQKFGAALGNDAFISADFNLIYQNDSIVVGDSIIKSNFFLFDINNVYFASIMGGFIIPTGPDGVNNQKYAFMSFGNDLMFISWLSLLKVKFVSIFSEIRYNFIDLENDLYKGVYINPVESKTYKTLLGLNVFHRDSFLYKDNLENDYLNADLVLIFDVASHISLGPVLKITHAFTDETAENLSIDKTNYFAGFEFIFSDKFSRGSKFVYIENLSDSNDFKRCFGISFFIEI